MKSIPDTNNGPAFRSKEDVMDWARKVELSAAILNASLSPSLRKVVYQYKGSRLICSVMRIAGQHKLYSAVLNGQAITCLLDQALTTSIEHKADYIFVD